MDSIQNKLKAEIKEETEEEKIDILRTIFILSCPAVRKTS
jgi:hypothetical protein